MSQQTPNEQSKPLGMNTNAEGDLNNKNSGEIIHREKIDNTPFELVGNEEKGYCIVFGKYKITPSFDKETKKDNETWQEYGERIIYTEQWNMITNMMVIFSDFIKIDILNTINKPKKE